MKKRQRAKLLHENTWQSDYYPRAKKWIVWHHRPIPYVVSNSKAQIYALVHDDDFWRRLLK
jgi:hypothetical protein